MFSKDNKKACPFTDEIVSYMYGEICGDAEDRFEEHLADCGICTDEFAAAANARFSVYEWKKEVFDPMPTPEILIPFEQPRDVSDSVGFFAAVKAWAENLSLPVAVAAALLLCLGLGLLVFSSLGKHEPQVANVPAPVVESMDGQLPEQKKERETAEADPPAPAVHPIRVSAARPVRPAKRVPKEFDKPANDFAVERSPQMQKAPALNAYQEPDDDSLRLADLFDEVGG